MGLKKKKTPQPVYQESPDKMVTIYLPVQTKIFWFKLRSYKNSCKQTVTSVLHQTVVAVKITFKMFSKLNSVLFFSHCCVLKRHLYHAMKSSHAWVYE